MTSYLIALGFAAALAGPQSAAPREQAPTIASCEHARADRTQLNDYIEVYGKLLADSYKEIHAGKQPSLYLPGLRAAAQEIAGAEQKLNASLEQCTSDALAAARR